MACWHYFIPKTKKETRYCDREWDEKSCKHLGPLARRRINEAQDNALEVYEILHHRNELRCDHYVNKISTVRESGYRLDVIAYGDWSEMAQELRRAYLDGKISAADFIAKSISIMNILILHTRKKRLQPGIVPFVRRSSETWTLIRIDITKTWCFWSYGLMRMVCRRMVQNG